MLVLQEFDCMNKVQDKVLTANVITVNMNSDKVKVFGDKNETETTE